MLFLRLLQSTGLKARSMTPLAIGAMWPKAAQDRSKWGCQRAHQQPGSTPGAWATHYIAAAPFAVAVGVGRVVAGAGVGDLHHHALAAGEVADRLGAKAGAGQPARGAVHAHHLCRVTRRVSSGGSSGQRRVAADPHRSTVRTCPCSLGPPR